jgi:hypothetical protein
MKTLEIGIPTSLGEIINIKWHLDLVKDQYDLIKINYARSLWDSCLHTNAPDWNHKKALWNKYLADISTLFFSNHPYQINDAGNAPFFDAPHLVEKIGQHPQKVELGHLLCKGNSLNQPYIVITTKVRHLQKSVLEPKIGQLWEVLNQLSSKYKIVILGEREVEMRKEYQHPHLKDEIFGIYNDIMANIANNKLDLTVPALGETVSDFSQVQQDCLIMKEAKCTITLGVGGNFCLATSVANMAIGFRADNIEFTDAIYNGRTYHNATVTKDWDYFINAIRSLDGV